MLIEHKETKVIANARMILPDIFERYADRDYKDDGGLFRVWRYKNVIEFEISFYTDKGAINWEINAASFIFSYAFRTPKPIDYII